MRNLKRVLSLAMASVMLLGMMVVGASAANFPDSDKIEHTEAVDTMVALGIILGTEDGTFDPERAVTRAEMAKMICVALNSGKDPNLTGAGLYPDIKGHWAAGYIDYCTNLGIVSGDDNGNFNPNATVTGVEAAKMLLIAIGYNAENERFVKDPNWDTNIGVRASGKGLYEDVAIVPTEGLSRDNAAQMIWNGMNAVKVEYDYKVGAVDGNVTSIAIAKDVTAAADTILKDKFKMDDITGVMQSYTYDKDEDQPYTYVIATSGDMAESNGNNKMTFTSTVDYTALFGQSVKVLFKETKTDAVYGMYDDSGLVLTLSVGDLEINSDGDKVKLDGTNYDLAAAASATDVFFAKTGADTSENLNAITKSDASTLKLISSDGDKKIDYAVVTPVTLEKVSYTGSKSITAGKSYTFEDNNIADDLKKDDFVTIVAGTYTFDGKANIEKANIVSGNVESTRGTAAAEIKVDGTWYKKGTLIGNSDTPSVGDDVDLVIVGGYYYNAKVVSETVKDILYVRTVGAYSMDEVPVSAYFTDGTSQRVTVSKVGNTAVANASDVTANTLYTYTVKDGKYELKALASDNKAGYEGVHTNADAAHGYNNKVIDGLKIADDAVIFVQTAGTNAGMKVLSGKQVKAWGDIAFANGSVATDVVMYAYDVVSGFDTIKVASLFSNTSNPSIPGAAGDEAYGYVVSEYADLVKEGDDYFVTFQVWNGETVLDVKEQGSNSTDTGAAQYAQGAFITYDALDGNEVDNVALLVDDAVKTNTTWASMAVTGVDQGSKDIALSATGLKDDALALKLTDDTKIIFVNTDDKEGITSEEITLATETAISKAFVKNAWALVDEAKGSSSSAMDAGDEVMVIFVDMAGLATNKGTVTTATVSKITAADAAAGTASTATDATGTEVATEAAGWIGALAAEVVDASGAAITDGKIPTTDDAILRVVAEDGTVFTFVLDGTHS